MGMKAECHGGNSVGDLVIHGNGLLLMVVQHGRLVDGHRVGRGCHGGVLSLHRRLGRAGHGLSPERRGRQGVRRAGGSVGKVLPRRRRRGGGRGGSGQRRRGGHVALGEGAEVLLVRRRGGRRVVRLRCRSGRLCTPRRYGRGGGLCPGMLRQAGRLRRWMHVHQGLRPMLHRGGSHADVRHARSGGGGHVMMGHGRCPRHPRGGRGKVGIDGGGGVLLVRGGISGRNLRDGVLGNHHGNHHHDLLLRLHHLPGPHPHRLIMRHGPPQFLALLSQFALLSSRLHDLLVPPASQGAEAGELGDGAGDEVDAVGWVEGRMVVGVGVSGEG